MDEIIKKLESVLAELKALHQPQAVAQTESLLEQAKKAGIALSKTDPIAIHTILAQHKVKSLTAASEDQLKAIIVQFNEALK
jgi:hypothetical protein